LWGKADKQDNSLKAVSQIFPAVSDSNLFRLVMTPKGFFLSFEHKKYVCRHRKYPKWQCEKSSGITLFGD